MAQTKLAPIYIQLSITITSFVIHLCGEVDLVETGKNGSKKREGHQECSIKFCGIGHFRVCLVSKHGIHVI